MQAVSNKKLEFGTAADSKKLEAGGLLDEYMYVAFDWYLRYLAFVLLYEPLRNRVQWSLNETNEASLLPKLPLPVVNPIRLQSSFPFISISIDRTLGEILTSMNSIRNFNFQSFSIILDLSFQKHLFTGFLLMLNAMVSVNYMPWDANNQTKNLFLACLTFLPINLVKKLSDRIPEMRIFADENIYKKVGMLTTESIVTSLGISKITETLGGMFTNLLIKLIVKVTPLPEYIVQALFSENTKKSGEQLAQFLFESEDQLRTILIAVVTLATVYKLSLVKHTANLPWGEFKMKVILAICAVFGVSLWRSDDLQGLMLWFLTGESMPKNIRTYLSPWNLTVLNYIRPTIYESYQQKRNQLRFMWSLLKTFYKMRHVSYLFMLFWVSAMVDILKTRGLPVVLSVLNYFIRKIKTWLAITAGALQRARLEGGVLSPEWKADAVPVLNRLRKMSTPTVQWQPSQQEQAAIDKVWSFVGVDISEYQGPSKTWTGVQRWRRQGVRRRLRDGFDEAAFFGFADVRAHRARLAFTRKDLLDWGNRLLAAEAGNDATFRGSDEKVSEAEVLASKDDAEQNLGAELATAGPDGHGKTSRFTGVYQQKHRWWRASISVRGSRVELGTFDDEEDAARAFDAALVKYKGKPTVNFPGEVPRAEVLAALPPPPPVLGERPPHVFLLNLYKLLTNEYTNIISYKATKRPRNILILIKDKLLVGKKLIPTNPDLLIRQLYNYGFKMKTKQQTKAWLALDKSFQDPDFMKGIVISHPRVKNIDDILNVVKKDSSLDTNEVANALADLTPDQGLQIDFKKSLKISFLIEALKHIVDKNQKNEIEEKQKTIFNRLQKIDLKDSERRNVLFDYMFGYLTRTISLDKLKDAAKIANHMYEKSLVLKGKKKA